MANGYLGKISAVVSANTADFQNKLNAAAKDVQKFASSMQGSLSSAQSSSSSALRGIYTDAQKLERALTAISTRKLQFKGFQGPDLQSAVTRMQALYSATEQINKPLAESAKSFGRLSLAVQGEFNPALVTAQASVEKLADTINRTGTASVDQFSRVARQVEVTTAAMSRMKEAGAMVSGLATGQELRFQRPEMAAEMRRSASVQSEAAQMAPEAMKSAGVAGLVQQQAAAARETERLAAALENEKLLVNGNVAAATSAYETQLAVQRRLNDEIERRVRLSAESANEGRSQDIRAYLQQLEDARQRTEALADARRRAQAASRFLQVDQNESNLMANEGRSQDIRAYLQQLEDARQRTESLSDAQRRAQAASRFLQVDQGESNLMANEGRSQDIRAYLQQLEDARLRTEALTEAQRRAQAASRFLQVDQGESDLMANEGRSQDIRAYLQQLEDARQRTEALTEAQRRAQAASRFLQVDQGESDLMANEGRSTPVGAGYYEDNLRRAAASSMGQDIEAPRRQLAVLQGSITTLKSQIDTMPDGLRTRFVPAIREAEAEFMRLSTAPAALPAEIEAARRSLTRLTQDVSRASDAMKFASSFGGEGVTGIRLGLDQRALQGEVAALTSLQGALGRTQAAARGPAVAAFNALRNAIAEAMAAGTLDEPATRQRIDRLRAAAVNATSQAGGGSVSRIRRDMQRAGDVGRGGFDNLSLAANQAAFAIDDFMSSTGGIDQKLRAVSNNVTQLAFVLGGTTGLFIGLGAVLAGQVAVGIVKFANNGRSAEDQTKALNEALARQKSLVEELAQAFKSLGDTMSSGTLSKGAESGTGFGKELSSIRTKQREIRENRIGDLDPDVQRGRADRNKLKKELESTTDPGRLLELQRSIQENEASDKRVRTLSASKEVSLPGAEYGTQGLAGILERMQRYLGSSVASRPMGTGPITNRFGIQDAIFQEAYRNMPNRNGPGGRQLTELERYRRAQDISSPALEGTLAAQRSTIENVIAQLRPATKDTFLGMQTAPAATASESIARLTSLLEQLEAPFQKSIDDLSVQVATASEDAARAIRDAQEDVADAIGRGVPGAVAFQRQLDSVAGELSEANAKLARAVEMSTEIDDPTKREAIVKEAEKQVADVRVKQAETEAKARAVRLGRSFGGERLTSAVTAMEGNERFKNERAGVIASARAAADDELQARRANDRQSAAVADRRQQLQDARSEMRKVQDAGGDTTAAGAAVKKAEADLRAAEASSRAAGNNLELAQAASEAAAALLDAAAGIESALTRIRKVGDSALQKSEQGADAAQKAFEENPLRGGALEARDAAEMQLIEDRAAVGEAQANLDGRRREIQLQPEVEAIADEIETIKQRRQDLEAKFRTEGLLAPAENAELKTATSRYVELIRQLEVATRELTSVEQKQRDAINNGIAAREKELETLRRKAEREPTFDRRREAAGQLAEGSRRQADEAQQRFINNPTEQNRRERDAADRRRLAGSNKAEELQDALDARRKEVERGDFIRETVDRDLSTINGQLAKLAEKEATVGLTEKEVKARNFLQGEARGLRGTRDRWIEMGTREERDAIDREQIAQNQRDRALRGRDLGLTDRERFRKEFTEGAGGDINARAKEMRDNGQDPTRFLRQAFQNQMESVAPMLQGFQDERRSAMLQGPSRAALNVSDVSTSQGASELTRLLRGDDSAKDVNLAELRKQSGYLEEIRDDFKRNNPGVLL